MEEPLTRELIIKFLAQQCTEAEKQTILQGINTPEGQKLFDEVLLDRWNQTSADANISDTQLFDWNQEIHNRIAIAGPAKKSVRFLSPAVLRYAGICAAVIIGVVLFNTLKTKNRLSVQPIAMREIVNPYGKRSIVTLPDSSVIYLGAGSKIRFPEVFAKNSRDITLEGEAFFDVKHRSYQAFIVHTGALQTRDIGTAFKITAFKNQPIIVALASGKVSIEKVKNDKILVLANLVPGQQSIWENGKLTTNNIPAEDIAGWKDGRLVFHETPLTQLTAVLERWYDVKFQYNNTKKLQEK